MAKGLLSVLVDHPGRDLLDADVDGVELRVLYRHQQDAIVQLRSQDASALNRTALQLCDRDGVLAVQLLQFAKLE